ncbi:hypothetical protein M3626_05945 [Psychrobacillus sp. MER TA 17]|nr:hypothetical protein [Psychrobacillus sp. MER TA 17]
MSKKWLITLGLLSAVALSACGNETTTDEAGKQEKETEQAADVDETKSDTDTKQSEPKEYDFDKLANKEIEVGTSVIISGQVTYADDEKDGLLESGTTYTVAADNMGEEVYWVKHTSLADVNLNDTVTVVGTYTGIDNETGIPLIDGDDPTVETTALNEDEEAEEFGSSVDEETGEAFEEGFGHMRTIGIGYNNEVGIDGTDAPLKPIEFGNVNLTINGMAIVEVEPDEEISYLFDDKEIVRAIIVDMEAENNSDADITFHPNQATLVTSAGEQVESDMFFLGDVGGDFYGGVKKADQTWWILENLDDDIESVTMIIDPPYTTDDWEDIGEEKRLEFEILTWDEAKERDGNN